MFFFLFLDLGIDFPEVFHELFFVFIDLFGAFEIFLQFCISETIEFGIILIVVQLMGHIIPLLEDLMHHTIIPILQLVDVSLRLAISEDDEIVIQTAKICKQLHSLRESPLIRWL